MPKATTMQNNFTSGEWSPRAKGRADLDKYKSGAGKIENFLINQLGGVSYRPGSRYVASTKADGAARLIPFQYSADQDYVLEFGVDYIRVYSNSADAVTVTSWPAELKLLLHCDGTDGATTIVDEIGKTVTAIGTAELDTAAYKFATASALYDGDSDYFQISDHADFDLVADTTNYTVDFWVKHDDHAGTEEYVTQYQGGSDRWQIQHAHLSGIRFRAVTTGGGVIIDTGYGAEIADTNWHHIALIKTGTVYSLYKDGTRICTTTDASTASYAGDLFIGSTGVPDSYFDGHIDEFRITQSNPLGAATVATCTLPTTPLAKTSSTEITSPYAVADVFDLQVAQNNDVMYIVHPDYAPYKLSRTDATSFSLDLVDFVRGPLLDTNILATTVTPSADTGAGITITFSVATLDYDGALAADAQSQVGSLWRIKSGMVKILTITSTTVATADVEAEPDGSAGDLNTGPGAVTDWAEGAFSAYRGYPSAIAFHEQRLYYANTENEPQKLWASYIAAYDSFDTTAVTDDYSITFEVATEQRNAIKWLSSGNRSLTVGTVGGTFAASSSNTLESIAPDNIVVNRDTNYGVAALPPKRISSFLYYLQRDYSKLRELSYSFQVDSTVSSDMTLFAEHILKDGDSIVDLDHQQSPNDRIFCVREDGEMSVLTRNPEQEVMGWCRFIPGTDSQGVGEYESVAVIPKSESDDQVWVVVKRAIGGVTKRFIEYFTLENFDEDWDAVRVDSSLTLDSPSTITGVTIATDLILYTAGDVALAAGDQIKINGVVGTTEINGIYKISAAAFTIGVSFKITTLADVAIDFAAYGAWVSGGEIRKMVTAISGLSHLDGETVSVQVDGGLPSTETYVVAAGAITLSALAAVVHVGLPYTGTLQLLKLSDGSATGTGQTRTRRIFQGTLRLDRSQGLSIGRTTTTLDDLSYSEETDEDALFTGDMEKVFQTTWDKADEIIIKQSKPQPANILAVILRSQVEEG